LTAGRKQRRFFAGKVSNCTFSGNTVTVVVGRVVCEGKE
jgi:hypothetical protein